MDRAMVIDRGLTEISLKYNLKLIIEKSTYKLESNSFYIKLSFFDDVLSYYIFNKYGLISYYFTKGRIDRIISDIKKFSLSENIEIDRLILNN